MRFCGISKSSCNHYLVYDYVGSCMFCRHQIYCMMANEMQVLPAAAVDCDCEVTVSCNTSTECDVVGPFERHQHLPCRGSHP